MTNPLSSTAEDIIDTKTFIAQTFIGQSPEIKKYWLKEQDKTIARQILGHNFNALRVRYWIEGSKSAWVLEEIGKVEPITLGVVIDQNQIQDLQVLAFRESRGWEVKFPFFTDQFSGVALAEQYELNRHIDGISGATLSVRAVTKVARLALYFADSITPVASLNAKAEKTN